MTTPHRPSFAFYRVFTLVCALAASQLGGCALETEPGSEDAARQSNELSLEDDDSLTPDQVDDASQGLETDPDPLPWQPEGDSAGSDPDPLPWQPDPLPWQPDPLPWQPDPLPWQPTQDTTENPAEMREPQDQPSSKVTQKVDSAVDDRR
ncbi:MAG: hypothetical protein AB7K71_27440 [Polyangiaceae bacterium]